MAGTVDFVDRESLQSAVSDNGTVTLSWARVEPADKSLEITLQQSGSDDFAGAATRYQGADSASVITGLPEGVHYFRISEADTSEWSEPLAITVKFFPRWKLWLILSIGGVVVLATIGIIIVGHFNTRNEEVEP